MFRRFRGPRLRSFQTFISRSIPRLKHHILHESTFFRLHLTAFILIPLVASAIFWGCNGRFTISFMDSLFLCYSAMTVTGLSTVNLSTLTAFQQVILFLLMLVGHPSFVSWIMVLVRKEYFRRECEWIYRKEKAEKDHNALLASISSPRNFFRAREPVPMNIHDIDIEKKSVVEPGAGASAAVHSTSKTPLPERLSDTTEENEMSSLAATAATLAQLPNLDGRLTKPDIRVVPPNEQVELLQAPTLVRSPTQSNTIRRVRVGVPLPDRNTTILSTHDPSSSSSTKGGLFGGFPSPLTLILKLIRFLFPNLYRKLLRTVTIPHTTTIQGRDVPWLTNNTTIPSGRNSHFYTDHLSDDQIEEIGGVEYAALRWLVWMVPMYIVGTQLISYLLFGPWLSVTHSYDSVFSSQFREVKKPWFALFQVTAAYTGGGLSLVDLGMLPFQTAYLMSISLMFAILAGNHALPIFLRFIIWVLSKIAPQNSDAQSAFDFLLHHPRRCYIYLFPSHQTWFLVLCLVLLSATEWLFFEVLDIGIPFFEALSTGTRIICGIFQGLSARAAGFPIVPMSSLAPAVQFMYIIMMYIAVYPVALSIRSTNVYEERSLGIFETPPEGTDDGPADLTEYGPRERVGRYIGWHLRRQLSIDIWWLVWGVFLVAIIERRDIMDENLKWFDMFHILFEMVSAFGCIGLSLGLPTDNFSFSGALHPLSKLVVIVIMVRGRHRGLPVRVDRAIMLPSELVKRDQNLNQNQNHAPGESGQSQEYYSYQGSASFSSDREERTNSYSS